MLIEKGANVNAKNNYGSTPLLFALKNKCSFETIQLLIDKGADVNAKDNNNKTPILYTDDPIIKSILYKNGAKKKRIKKDIKYKDITDTEFYPEIAINLTKGKSGIELGLYKGSFVGYAGNLGINDNNYKRYPGLAGFLGAASFNFVFSDKLIM